MQLINKLKRSWRGLNVYAITLRAEISPIEAREITRCLFAYSLEEAINLTVKDALNRFPGLQWRLFLFDTVAHDDLLTRMTETEIKEETEPTDKNVLMNEIIQSGDVKLYERHSRKFTPSERKLIEEKLSQV